jgi:hypothetical protein
MDEWGKIYLNGYPFNLQHEERDNTADDVLESIYNAIKDNEVE